MYPPRIHSEKKTIPKERWWQDLPRWVEDGAPQLRGTVVGLIKNWGIAWDIPNLMVVKNHFFPPIFVAAGKIWSADKREPIWENVKPWSPLIDALLRAWCQTHTSSDCQPCQVEDTLGNGMILDLLKEVDGNGDGVHRLPGGVAKLQCMQRHNMDFCPPHLFYLCESFWICGFVCFRPRHFQLQKSESDAASASALKISCPRSSFRWCGAERSRPEAMPSEAGIRVSWVRISNLGMILIFSIVSFNYGWCSHVRIIFQFRDAFLPNSIPFRSFCFFPTKPFNPLAMKHGLLENTAFSSMVSINRNNYLHM